MSFGKRKDTGALSIEDVTKLISVLKQYHDRLVYRSDADLDIQVQRYFPAIWEDSLDDDGLRPMINECVKELSEFIRDDVHLVRLVELESDLERLIRKLTLFVSYVPDKKKMDKIINKKHEEMSAVVRARREEEKKSTADNKANSEDDYIFIDDSLGEFDANPYLLPDELNGHKMTYEERKKLLDGEEVLITDFVAKDGTVYSAYVHCDEFRKYKLRFV